MRQGGSSFEGTADVHRCKFLMSGDFEAFLNGISEMSASVRSHRDVTIAIVPTDFGSPTYVSALDLADAYGEQVREEGEVTVRSQKSEGECRRDLRNLTGLSKDALLALRRRLAIANHPDLVPSEFREEATKRMSRINEIIDYSLAVASAGAD